ncbi:translation initiation factor IF-2 subunit beta [Encephalitozoon hellem ATCC 50504]|uniref:Eukaryotic translation initiation factor 5 n=1 Tax=Encephalitozoon hellem TaxID=27973 RepID=A0A9Q9C3R3_ENCHE|nr:translation initiation factor IF-2 subunit beta [Encephalitozoon hellem ATCC 50504]AFM98657.1 translation initiation factor IF-2 subunit beta [Encephalitozoon hellem ATCC 50504]UTX43606.1 eukaryotic translation initiation factor 5 [Encephalitozoon hellem]WEL39081.1 eukaryotic translation initiation factor 5 [Encephalitozoon hellem]|eukprot:XP_003887638.1 translation initiation factor IF-2 subunit beta [Encephalitozoon hellem ATCC 50504]
MIDISRTNNDLYYRYKMPKAVIKVEGKAGNTRTVIVNLEEIGSSLKRSPLYILKFMSYELATRIDAGKGRYAVNGRYECSRIQDLIYDFIDGFVMCSFCNNPETFYVNNGGLFMECLACGKRSGVKASKLSGTILKDVEKNSFERDDTYLSAAGMEDSEYKDDIRRLMESDCDRSEDVVNLLKDHGLSDEKIAKEVLMFDGGIKKCKKITEFISPRAFLSSVEEIVEDGGEKKKIQEYLRMLEEEKMFKRSELFKYFTRPQGNKKRSPEFKKEVSEYFSNQ